LIASINTERKASPRYYPEAIVKFYGVPALFRDFILQIKIQSGSCVVSPNRRMFSVHIMLIQQDMQMGLPVANGTRFHYIDGVGQWF
jgi:hypothetical protein